MSAMRRLRWLVNTALVAALLVLTVTGMAAPAAPVLAAPLATYYVDAASGNDGNACLAPGAACKTIAAAVAKASHDDTIQIAAGVYHESQITIDKRLTLEGASAATTIVDAGQNGRAFTIYAASTLRHLTVRNGQTPEDPNIFNSGGGGLLITGVTVLLQHVVIQGNSAANSGGAIFNTGQLTIDQSSIVSNTAQGWGWRHLQLRRRQQRDHHHPLAPGRQHRRRPLRRRPLHQPAAARARQHRARQCGGGGRRWAGGGQRRGAGADDHHRQPRHRRRRADRGVGRGHPHQRHRERQHRQQQLQRHLCRRRDEHLHCHQQYHRLQPRAGRRHRLQRTRCDQWRHGFTGQHHRRTQRPAPMHSRQHGLPGPQPEQRHPL
jgi:predicted outer membrane repeat protein